MQRPGKVFTRPKSPKSEQSNSESVSNNRSIAEKPYIQSMSPKVIARIDEESEALLHNGHPQFRPKLVEGAEIFAVYTPLESGIRDVVGILHSMKVTAIFCKMIFFFRKKWMRTIMKTNCNRTGDTWRWLLIDCVFSFLPFLLSVLR